MQRTATARRPTAARLAIATTLVAFGFALLAPTRLDIAILLREVMRSIGIASLSAAGLISTATLLGDGLTEMFWGRVADRWSRGGVLAGGIALYSIFSILTAVATTLPMLYLMRILLGVGQAMFIPAYFAYVGSMHGKRRGFLLGSLAGLFTIGVAVNPILTDQMFKATGQWQTPFIGYGAFGLALAVGVFIMARGKDRIYETRAADPTPVEPIADDSRWGWLFHRNMRLLLVTMMFWGLTQYGFLGIFVTYLRTEQHFSLGDAATVASVAGWFAFGFSFVAGFLSDHVGRRWTLIVMGTVGVIAAAPIFILPQSFLSAMLLASVFQAANGTFYPLGVAYAQDSARAEHLGAHSGAVSGLGHLVAGVAGFIVGGIAEQFGYAMVGWFFAAASVVMVVTIAMTRDPRRTLAAVREAARA